MTDPLATLTTSLAHRYTIERELGHGGMATVYLARDLRHDRPVALKVLRPELAAVIGAERFLAEIKTTANLQHPHILPLHDSGDANGFLFYVMPLVEGESLRDRLQREKQLPVTDAIRIATEVASALDYAHRHGVVHRDIKPENILLHDGQALVADFGIALAVSSAGGARMTETGMSLGTPHYMSPEQAMGEREISPRSDVYALGCVLYEMLAGEPPFTGPTAQAIVAKVLTESPRPLLPQRHTIPAHVEAAILVALEKLPADRFASAAELAEALKDPGRAHRRPARAGREPARARPAWWDWRYLSAGIALLALGGAGGMLLAPHPADPTPVARFRIPLSEGTALTGAPVNTLALTPDGRTIVYVAAVLGVPGGQLYARRLEDLEARPLPGSSGGTFPAISPDGRRVAYFAPGGLFVMPLAGGTPTQVANIQAQALAQAIWLDDRSLVATAADGSLVRVGLDGSLHHIASPDSATRETYLGVNVALPDGHTVLAIAATGSGVNGILYAIDIGSGKRTRIMDAVINGVWYSDGHLLWAQPDGTLLGAAFDPGSKQVGGPPATLAQRVRLSVGGPAQAAVSATGSMVYIPEQPFNLMLLDRSGRRQIIGEGHRFHSPRFSPDGRRLAVDFTQGGSRDVWSLDLRQGTLSRVTFEDDGHDPVWTPDGRSIIYVHLNGVFRRRADGSGTAESLYVSSTLTGVIAVTRDGSTAITSPTGSNGSFDLGLLSLGPERRQESLLATPFNEQHAVLSPDGRWMAYVSDETGRNEVYVRPFPEGGAKILVSQNGGAEPHWNPNGRELFYVGVRDGRPYLIATAVITGQEFTVGARTPLFDMSEFEPSSPHANYDVSPDGQRFAMVHQGALGEMVFVQKWTEEVRRRSRGGGP